LTKEKLFLWISKAIAGFFRVFGRRRQATALSYVAEALVPIWRESIPRVGDLLFYGPSYKAIYRGWTLRTKEPETIGWIDKFQPNSVLWDIGACVGTYSLYAGIQGHKVLAFEPAAGNYHVLNQNILLNGLDGQVIGYCVALTDQTKLDALNFMSVRVGASHNQFGVEENVRGEPFRPGFKQGAIGYSIDYFVDRFQVQIPDYIKIDVDGIEESAIRGGRQNL